MYKIVKTNRTEGCFLPINRSLVHRDFGLTSYQTGNDRSERRGTIKTAELLYYEPYSTAGRRLPMRTHGGRLKTNCANQKRVGG